MNKKIAILFLVIIYTVGWVGIGLNYYPDLRYGTPINLLISLAIVLVFDKHDVKQVVVFSVLVFGLGYGIEMIGVQTGIIFGAYSYGSILGLKIADTPLMIGINWLLLVYTVGQLVDWVCPKIAWIGKAMIGATLLLLLDLLIEPIAIQWNMWTWEAVEVPMQNYLAWWVIGLAMCCIYYQLLGKQVNKVGAFVFIIQVVFFGLLNVTN